MTRISYAEKKLINCALFAAALLRFQNLDAKIINSSLNLILTEKRPRTAPNMKFEKIYYIAFFSGLVESCLWNSILDSNSHVTEEMKAKVPNDEMDIDYLHDTELTPVEILEALLRKPRSLDYFEDDKIIFDFCDSNNDGALTWSEMVNCFR